MTARASASVGPDGAAGVAEDRGGQALGDAHQAGPIHFHDQVVHLDPSAHTDRQTEESPFVAASLQLLGHDTGREEQILQQC